GPSDGLSGVDDHSPPSRPPSACPSTTRSQHAPTQRRRQRDPRRLASLLASGPNSTATAPRGKATHVAAPMTAVSVTTTPLATRAAACTSYFSNPERRPAMLNLIHRLLGID